MRVGRTNPSRRPDPRVDSLVPEGAARKSSAIGASDEGEPACLNLTQQEEELIGLLRESFQDFALTITFKSGHWYVGLHAPQTSRQRSDGDGPTLFESLGRHQTIVDVIFAQKRQRSDLRQLQATEKFLHSYYD